MLGLNLLNLPILTPFDTSIEETIKWHDDNKLWDEGKAGPTVEQEAAFLKTLKK